MSTVNKKELSNEAYNAASGGVSMVAKKVAAKLVLAVGASMMFIKYGHEKKWIPIDPFKSA